MPKDTSIGPKLRSDFNFTEEDFHSWGKRALLLGDLIDDISRIQGSVMDRYNKPLRITRSQAWLLAYVSWRPNSTLTDIARALNVTNAAVRKLVDHLVAREFVQIQTDDDDKRLKRIVLKPKGRKTVKKVALMGERIAQFTIGSFEESEAEVIIGFLLDLKAKLVIARDSEPGMLESMARRTIAGDTALWTFDTFQKRQRASKTARRL